MPCCVIGSTSDFGSDSLGSSPSEAAKLFNDFLAKILLTPRLELEEAADLKSV